ncbi:MAG: Asp-tRNA(Asn)/Glu-tRNA(Gln) amidotransferase subunit GatB [Candidatus Cyclobacteriaceae bacterium M2_1C_046]
MDQDIRSKYTAVIGLEVHAQLLTKSKIYAPDSTQYGSQPNTNLSVITLAHPGALPRLNKKVVEYAIKMGLACKSEISRHNIFDRKNYFYPDLPKGYQITQDKTPICIGGFVTITTSDGKDKDIHMNRIHIEEDAGKSIHLAEETDTLVDFNRAGVPLIEVVTEPDIRSSDEAYAFLTEVRRLVRYLEICDGNMEEGSLRCDANISVMLKDSKEYGKKVEVKNMNSIRNVQRAIDHEIERQIEELEKGNKISSETRTFDAVAGTTASMRTKEELNDYRYFPDPDLSPLVVSEEWLSEIKETMPSLPRELYDKFIKDYQLPAYDAQVLADNKGVALYFEELAQKTSTYKAASNWVMGPIKSHLNDRSLAIDDFPLDINTIAKVIKLVEEDKLSFTAASQNLFPALIEQPHVDPQKLAEKMDLIQESNAASIEPVIDEVLKEWPEKVKEYRNGKKNLVGLFMGEVMKKTRGKADPKLTNQLLREKLK